METRYIAAIDLGTSKIAGIIGKKSAEGRLTVEAIEREDSGTCIKRGCILNVEDAASRIKKIITKLENRIAGKIEKIYVGIGGQSVHTIDYSISRQLNEDTQVTEELIASMLAESKNFPVYNSEIIGIVPTEFLVDNRMESHPKGIFCSDIQANLKLIIGRPSLKKNIFRCLTEKIKIPVAGYIPSAQATAAVALSDNEKSLGCVLIDFGAGTTTVSIYKDDFLRYIATIPFGGRNLTRDICSLNVLEPEAEKLKIAYGTAIVPSAKEMKNTPSLNIEGVDATKIKYQTLCRVTEARIEEIVQNIIAQIEESGYAKQLSAGIVITGGASQLRQLPELLKQKTGMEVRKATLPKEITFANRSEAVLNPAYIQAIGLVSMAEEHCLKEIETEPIETPTTGTTGPSTPTNPKQTKTPKPPTPPKKGLFDDILGIFSEKVGKILEEDDNTFKK